MLVSEWRTKTELPGHGPRVGRGARWLRRRLGTGWTWEVLGPVEGCGLVRARWGAELSAPAFRLAIFAGVHGDEPAGVFALADFGRVLAAEPSLARDCQLDVYPFCNPTGLAAGTRHAACGRDLNREFWRQSTSPEVRLLEAALLRETYHGLISLHADDTSDGLYGFVRGALLAEHLLRPALTAARAALPINQGSVIDGFPAADGLITACYEGILCAPHHLRPEPFEIIFETPALAPLAAQRRANVLALRAILAAYRPFLAYGADL